MTPEEKKAYLKEWRKKNKEKVKQTRKEWNENNKEKLHKKAKEWRDNNKDKLQGYRQNPLTIKSNIISKWKQRGLIHDDYDALYNSYLQATHCDFCKNEFKNTFDKCLDHNHQTKLFRAFLCRACNICDVFKHQT